MLDEGRLSEISYGDFGEVAQFFGEALGGLQFLQAALKGEHLQKDKHKFTSRPIDMEETIEDTNDDESEDNLTEQESTLDCPTTSFLNILMQQFRDPEDSICQPVDSRNESKLLEYQSQESGFEGALMQARFVSIDSGLSQQPFLWSILQSLAILHKELMIFPNFTQGNIRYRASRGDARTVESILNYLGNLFLLYALELHSILPRHIFIDYTCFTDEEEQRVALQRTQPVNRTRFRSFSQLQKKQLLEVNLEENVSEELWWKANVETINQSKKGVTVVYPTHQGYPSQYVKSLNRIRPSVKYIGWRSRQEYLQLLKQYGNKIVVSFGFSCRIGESISIIIEDDKYCMGTLHSVNKSIVSVDIDGMLTEVPSKNIRPWNGFVVSSWHGLKKEVEVAVFCGDCNANTNNNQQQQQYNPSQNTPNYWQYGRIISVENGTARAISQGGNILDIKSLEQVRWGMCWVGGLCVE